jgi:hypothetical protein
LVAAPIFSIIHPQKNGTPSMSPATSNPESNLILVNPTAKARDGL